MLVCEIEKNLKGFSLKVNISSQSGVTALMGAHRNDGRGAYHNHRPHTSSANSTIIRNLAHCSSSARMLPSSVDAKPHCGDRQS